MGGLAPSLGMRRPGIGMARHLIVPIMFIIALAVLIVLAVIRLAALTCVRTFPFASGRPAPERDFRHDHGNGAPLVVWSRTLYYYKQPRTRVIIEEFGITVIAAHTVRAMCSIPIEFGCDMNSFEADYQRPSSRRARLISLIS